MSLDWKKFEPLFGTWASRIRPFVEGSGLDPVYTFLRLQSGAGKSIAPASMNTFKAFIQTPYEEVKCVIICPEPYSKFVNGAPIASGVAMDCSVPARTQSALDKFYKGIENELFNGLDLNYVNSHDLSHLTSQGVLFLTASFTVEKDNPGSHSKIWEPFISFLLTDVLAVTGIPILFLGNTAHLCTLVARTNPCFVLDDPADVAPIGGEWETNGVFTQLNRRIWDTNKDCICWLPVDLPF